jgi:uncharacterized protein (TIGR03000 family)
MFCIRQSFVSGTAAATAALLLAAGMAPAQSTGGFYYETYRYGYNPGYYARRYPAAYDSASFGPYRTVTKTTPGAVSAGALLRPAPAPSGAPQGGASWLSAASPRVAQLQTVAPGTSARLELRVPEAAEVWFGEVRAVQTGALRVFESPPLAPGKEYVYEVRVVWQVGGREVAESREVTVRAGEQVADSFPRAAAE